MLSISPEKVAQVIVRAREFDAKVARWDAPGDSRDSDTILESRSNDATESELRTIIEDLPQDQQHELVAVMWIGRDSFSSDELFEAIATAREEATTPTADYLLGVPLLSDFLENGMEALGYSIEDIEDGVL